MLINPRRCLMERTFKNWYLSGLETPVIVKISARTILLFAMAVLVALAIIFAAPSDFVSIENLIG
jgi:hypothetical protein